MSGARPCAAAPPKVVATTEDLAALVREVGGDTVSVESLAKGYQDPHFVEPKPSFILKLHDADLLVVVGRELEIGWLPPLLTQSRNAKIQVGGPGYLDASTGVQHPGDPDRPDYARDGRRASARQPALLARSGQWPRHRASRSRQPDAALAGRQGVLRSAIRGFRSASDRRRNSVGTAAMAPYKGTKVVTYHRSWPNFTERFGLDVIGYVEPKPGIPPSPSHTIELIAEMKRQNVKLILVEPYFDLKTPESIARADRRQGAGAGAVGGRRQGSGRLHRAVRLQRQSAGRHVETTFGPVSACIST